LEKYLLNNRDELKNLIEKWAKVPTIEENPDYYSDFGQNEHFSLKGRGPGEEY
jgi:sulfite reductase (ferredoxin)